MKISWETLDKLNSSDAIYEFLLKKKIKGYRGNGSSCPLAVATGYSVSASSARRGSEIRRLTDAEGDFVDRFDQGEYPELDSTRSPRASVGTKPRAIPARRWLGYRGQPARF